MEQFTRFSGGDGRWLLQHGRKGELVRDLISRNELLHYFYMVWDWSTVDGINTSTALRQAMTDIQEFPPARRWIPVTERLPEKTGKYLVSVKNGNVYAGTFSAYEGAFNCAATAWMELPEPYKEPEDPSHPCADSVMMGD